METIWSPIEEVTKEKTERKTIQSKITFSLLANVDIRVFKCVTHKCCKTLNVKLCAHIPKLHHMA